MNAAANRIFISYRRDDAAGYAGRLEEALERRLGRGSVFRDVLDITPGDDFVAAIRSRLAGAQAVLVLIGPRWAGVSADGTRRIDDAEDFVRLEVAMALDSATRVLPVLLPGAAMPAEDSLPEPLKALARRNALSIGDTSWDADIGRLVASLGLAPKRRVWPWALGGVLLAAALAAGWLAMRPAAAPPAAPITSTAPKPDAAERLIGSWQADVRYAWGDRYIERFELKRHAGEVTGTASFLKVPRAIEKLQIDGNNLRFETRSTETMGASTREVTRAYAAELRGQPPGEVLVFRMHSTGGHSSAAPIEFEARRVAAAASAPTARASP